MGVATLCFFPLILTFILRDSFARLPLVRDLVRPYNPKPEEFMTAAQDPATLIQPKPEDFAMHSPSAPQDPATILQSDHQDPATLPQYKPEEPVLFTPSSVPKDPAKYPESRFQDLTIPSEPHAASLTNTSVRLLEQRSEFLEQPTQGNDNNLHLKPVDPHVIIYNRVPKCASATMLRICLGLSERNNFSFNNMRDLGRHDSREDQEKLGKWIFQRSLASRHFFFEHMTYINFTSLGFWEPSWINVVRHPVEAEYPSPAKAKQVVEKEFVVVGIQEQLDDTLLSTKTGTSKLRNLQPPTRHFRFSNGG
ncbi:putative uronyl 2-sulfotransferase-like [Penaeus vannamei]|uniref:Putative uronyl 2-sulfotransferase-like n=1 Tax=Penaeus vannamei TaxID=6689 RepID=A0A3R7QYN7_PENVA|nr:putative uronyl 2-sulfotransferase-like [Penaeus vannamei]